MKIVMINGSPRKNGATSYILHALEKKLLEHDDVQIEYYDLIDLKVNICSGCCACYKTGKCHMNDDAELLSDKIAVADGLIMGSPTYASNVSGLMKMFIDRGHFVIEQMLYNKYAISVATGENYGSKDTSKVLNKLMQYSGALLTGKIVYNTPFNTAIKDEKLKKQVDTLASKYYWDIRKKKKHPIQSMIHNIIFHVGINPFVKQKGEKYKGVLDKWDKINR